MVRAVVSAMLVGGVLWVCACAGKSIDGEEGDDGSSAAGTSSKGGSSAMPAGSPAKKCESYANAWCTRSFNCYVKVGRLKQADLKYNIDQCNKLIVEKLPCSAIQSVGSNYPACIQDINAMACTKFDVPPEKFGTVPQPPSCDEALSF